MTDLTSPWINFTPDDHVYITFLKKIFRHEFRKNWFRRISSKNYENREDLEKIFSKEYISSHFFETDSKKYLKLFPNISNYLAYSSENLDENIQPVYLYYVDYFFSKDKFWVFNREDNYLVWWDIIWETDPILDALEIFITYSILNRIWLADTFEISVNCVLSDKEAEKYLIDFKDFYYNKKHLLSEKSLENLENNPLELLNPQTEDEKILLNEIPQMKKYLKKDNKTHFEKFISYLEMLEIPFKIDNSIHPNTNFASHTFWNFKNSENWEIISVWWRYDNLSSILNEKDSVWWVWFAVNMEILIKMLKTAEIKIKNKDDLDLYFVQLWDDAKKEVLTLSMEAKSRWIKTMVSIGTNSMKEQMIKAQRSWARFIVLVWIMEARSGKFQVRNNDTWKQEEVLKDNLIDYVISYIWEENLDFYSPAKDFIIE